MVVPAAPQSDDPVRLGAAGLVEVLIPPGSSFGAAGLGLDGLRALLIGLGLGCRCLGGTWGPSPNKVYFHVLFI